MPILLAVRDLRVRSLDLDYHELSWAVESTTEDILDYRFQVLRSESPSGPFDPISAPFSDRYIFIDNAIHVADRWRQYHYLLRVSHVPSGDTLDAGPVAKDPEPDRVALELRRHMTLLFMEFAGRRCWVLPARTWGQRCECWNATLQQRRRSGCPLCFDVGFVRGYLSPIETWIQFDASPKTEQTTSTGAQQQSNTTARLCYYPSLKPRDLIIEGENRRWRVVQVNQTEQLRAAVHQEVQLHEIPPRDIEFTIPLRMDEALRDMWFSPRRNYSNPQHLGRAQGEEVALSIYKKAP